MASGFAAGAGADMLQQILRQKFAEAMQQQELKEQQRQADMQQQVQQQRLGQDQSQFDTSMGQRQQEFGLRTREYEEAAPQRAAGLEHVTAQTADIKGRPQMAEAARAAQQAAADEQRGFTAEQNDLGRQNAVRIANINGSRPRDERLVQIEGPNGAAQWVRESQAVGKPAAQAARAVTGAERQGLAYFNRAQEADQLANQFEGGVAEAGLGSQLQQQYAPNMLQTSDQQSYRQAQRAFTEARLRKESGAAIPQGEYENDARTYFAQPGDSPQVREQKRKSRQTVLEGLKFSSGRAHEEFYGTDGPSQKGSGPQVGERRTINGKIGEWDGKGWKAVQ